MARSSAASCVDCVVRRGALGGGSGPARLAQAVACELDAVSVMEDAVEDGVGVGRIADEIVPFVDGDLISKVEIAAAKRN